MKESLISLQSAAQRELERILDFWSTRALDKENGGFFGAMDAAGVVIPDASKGAVLNSRILWTFSAATLHTGEPKYRAVADRAYAYCRDHFYDTDEGGLFWTVDASGRPLDTHKQIYALAFGIYGFVEYVKLTGDRAARSMCIELFEWIERVSFDPDRNGYFDAFDRRGKPLDDMRLSAKDPNAPKTMNTHLHILEAYTSLYRIWKEPRLCNRLENIIELFTGKIIDPDTHHLNLFFTADWDVNSTTIQFGHDIQASWLLCEAADSIDDGALLRSIKKRCPRIVDAASEGLQHDGSLFYEFDRESGEYDKHREWWVCAEAVIGFLNAFQVCHKKRFLDRAFNTWKFIDRYLFDKLFGEWEKGVDDRYTPLRTGKIDMWKCPYHNSRACMEAARRCGEILDTV